MSNRFVRALVYGTSAFFFLAGPASAGDNPIVVGQVIDLSGPNASIGRDYVAGIKTCFDMVNSQGGIHGRRIHLTVRDDGGQAEAAAKAATELIERDGVDYLFGGVGDEQTKSIVDAPAFRRSSLTLFAPLANSEFDAGTRILFWRPEYQQEIRHLFAHFSKLGIASVGIAYQETRTSQAALHSLTTEIRERQMRVVATARIGENGERIAQEAKQLAMTQPGFVLVIADTINTAMFLKEYRKHDAQRFVAGTSLVNLATLRELAGERATEWTVFSQVVPNPAAGTSLIQVEHMSMMRKFRDETVSALTLEGFAAAKTLVTILQQAKGDRRTALYDFRAQKRDIDIGGLLLSASRNNHRLSSYLDTALLRKGSGLMF
ncbi:MAG TPA: ABC transporter substrate-binding protein [Noviherbaspirillum sp.]